MAYRAKTLADFQIAESEGRVLSFTLTGTRLFALVRGAKDIEAWRVTL